MRIYIMLLLVTFLTTADKIKVWKEKRGVAVLEAEHIQTRNDLPLYWSSEKTVDGYTGTGYLYWSGASYVKEDYENLDEERMLQFYVSITREGVYYVKIKGLCLDEYETHVLVRINGSDWFNYTIQNNESFNWDSNSGRGLCAAFMQLGYHKIEIAAISAGFMLDKIELVHESDVDKGEVSVETLESNRESGNEYLPADQF